MSIKDEIHKKQAETERLTALLALYPDLTKETNRWGHTFLCSPAINSQATHHELFFSCGCCPDPVMYARMFIETEHGRVYALPHKICIGERLDYRPQPSHDWEETLRGHSAPEAIITQLRKYFDDEARKEEVDDE